jgi:hypothetical protein
MGKRKIPSDKTLRAHKRLVITLEQKLYMTERHERSHINCKIGRDVGMPKSTARNIIKHAGEIKEKCKDVSDMCGLHNIYKKFKCYNDKIECLLTAWIEDYNQKHIPLSRAVV